MRMLMQTLISVHAIWTVFCSTFKDVSVSSNINGAALNNSPAVNVGLEYLPVYHVDVQRVYLANCYQL